MSNFLIICPFNLTLHAIKNGLQLIFILILCLIHHTYYLFKIKFSCLINEAHEAHLKFHFSSGIAPLDAIFQFGSSIHYGLDFVIISLIKPELLPLSLILY